MNTINTDSEFNIPNSDPNYTPLDTNLKYKVGNEICQLRKILDKITLFALEEEKAESMLAWTEMGIELSYAIKYLMSSVILSSDGGVIESEIVDEDDSEDNDE